jgi:hypothetical protein
LSYEINSEQILVCDGIGSVVGFRCRALAGQAGIELGCPIKSLRRLARAELGLAAYLSE